jgi:hypothetical protein
MQPRAILNSVGLVLIVGCQACMASPRYRQVTPVYDEFTRRLIAIYADQNADGRMDQWTYFEGNRPLRGEKDADEDGRIDRWEYFSPDAALERVGSSSRNDGVEDMWTYPAPANAEGRIDRSRNRDRRIDRREYFRDGVLARAEEDTNADGRIDRWDRYDAAVLSQAEFDTTFTAGRPNHRVVYGAGGKAGRVELDPELDGTFVPAVVAARPR